MSVPRSAPAGCFCCQSRLTHGACVTASLNLPRGTSTTALPALEVQLMTAKVTKMEQEVQALLAAFAERKSQARA